jgi:phage shock protein A
METNFDNLAETRIDSLTGLDSAAAKEYILGIISTLKLTEKEIQKIVEEESLWEGRAKLAVEKGRDDLAGEALKECERLRNRRAELETEAAELKANIENLKAQLLILPAKERSIDPDLLEQELLILSGRLPGEEKEAERDRAFEKLEKEASADAALEELKAKMGQGNS